MSLMEIDRSVRLRTRAENCVISNQFAPSSSKKWLVTAT